MAERVLKGAAELSAGGDLTEIDVHSSVIGSEIDRNSRIINATLVMVVRDGEKGGEFEVKAQSAGGGFEIIDYITSAGGGDVVRLNITEEVNRIIKDTQEKVTVRIEGGPAFEKNILLETEYIPERIMYGNNAYYEVKAGRGGIGKINMATGGLNLVHRDSAGSGISHVYNSWQAGESRAYFEAGGRREVVGEYGCGKGWKLNLQQYLIKRKGTATQDLYAYIDGEGNYHEFSERYYYKAEGVKQYVKKENVEIDVEGKKIFAERGGKTHEIKTEQKTTGGWILQAESSGFAGSEKLELRSEERARLEEEIESLKRSKSDCEYAVEEYGKAESAGYKSLIRQQERIEDETAEIDRRSVESYYAGEGFTETYMGKKAELEGYIKKGDDGKYLNNPGADYEAKLDVYNTKTDIVQKAQIENTPETPGEEYKLDEAAYGAGAVYKVEGGPAKSEMEAQKKASDDLAEAQKRLNKSVDLLQQAIREASDRIESIHWEETKNEHARRVELQQKQAEYRAAKRAYDHAEEERQTVRNNGLYERTVIDLEKAEKLLAIRRNELERLKEREPARFLTDASGAVMAFNEAGALIAVADAYENVTYIRYEGGKIVGVTDSDNNGKEVLREQK